jgi:hypothetical protein
MTARERHAAAGMTKQQHHSFNRGFLWLPSDLQGTQRGSFHDAYIFTASMRDKRAKFPRLLDLLKSLAGVDDPEYFFPCSDDEFAVVDQKTLEKAWFETPNGASSDTIKLIIENHFAAGAFRASLEVWVV